MGDESTIHVAVETMLWDRLTNSLWGIDYFIIMMRWWWFRRLQMRINENMGDDSNNRIMQWWGSHSFSVFMIQFLHSSKFFFICSHVTLWHSISWVSNSYYHFSTSLSIASSFFPIILFQVENYAYFRVFRSSTYAPSIFDIIIIVVVDAVLSFVYIFAVVAGDDYDNSHNDGDDHVVYFWLLEHKISCRYPLIRLGYYCCYPHTSFS